MRYFFQSIILIFLPFTLSAFEGFYLGVSTGGSATIGAQRGEIVSIEDSAMQFLDQNSDFIDGTWEAIFFAGYGWQWKECLYTGLEGFLRYSHNDFKIRRETTYLNENLPDFLKTSSTSQMEIGPVHVGVDARLGYLLNLSTLLYARLGLEWAKFKVTHRASFLTEDFELVFSKRKHPSSAHFRAGVGIEKRVCNHLCFRADYLFTKYGGSSFSGTRILGNSSVNDSTKIHLRNHSLLLGLSYYFCNCPPFYMEEGRYFREFCGFYLAAAAGGTLFEGKLRGNNFSELSALGDTAPFQVTLPEFVVNTSLTGIAYAGFGYQWCTIFSGIEVFLQINHPSRKRIDENHLLVGAPVDFNTFYKTRAEIHPWQIGVAYRPGVLLTPSTLLFGTVGTSAATIELNTRAHARFENMGVFPTVETSLTHKGKNTRATLRLGGGLEYAFCSCWHMRAEYIYTDFGSIRVKAFSTNTEAGPPEATAELTANTKVHFKTHEVTLGIAKYF